MILANKMGLAMEDKLVSQEDPTLYVVSLPLTDARIFRPTWANYTSRPLQRGIASGPARLTEHVQFGQEETMVLSPSVRTIIILSSSA